MSVYAVYAHGRLTWDEDAARAFQTADVRLAVDGGAWALLQRGLRPDVAIGDWDSLGPQGLAQLRVAGVLLQTFPADKDATDLELALHYAADRGATEVHVFGALGGRWDQSLANLLLLAQPRLRALRIVLYDRGQRVWLLQGRETIAGEVGDTLALIPVQGPARGVTLRGVAYPLTNGELPWAVTLGVSNRLTAPQAYVQVDEGLVWVVHIPQAVQRGLEAAQLPPSSETLLS